MSFSPDGFGLDTRRTRRAFDRAAEGYDAVAVLQTRVRDELLQRLDLIQLSPGVVLDAGAGTGHASRALQQRYPKALVLAVDHSIGMLRVAGRQRRWLRRFGRVCADLTELPLATASVDLIVSNLVIHWCDPEAIFAEFARILAPNGLLALSTFGPDTLRELRAAWAAVDPLPHVHTFIDMHDLGDALVRNGFAAPVLDVDTFTLQYPDPTAVMADLRALGATNAAVNRRRTLLGRGRLAAMQTVYEGARRDGHIPATYEVVFAHAWRPAAPTPRPDSQVSLAEMRRKLKDYNGG